MIAAIIHQNIIRSPQSPLLRADIKILPMTHSIEAVVPEVDPLFHSNPKDQNHKEDPQEEVQAVFASS